MIIDRWTRDGLEVEISTIVDIGAHGATEIDLSTLLELVDDLQDALAGDGDGDGDDDGDGGGDGRGSTPPCMEI